MELRQPIRQILEHLLVLIEPAAAHGVTDALHARQHQTHVVLGAVQDVVGGLLVEVTWLQPAEEGCAAHGGLHDAVLDLHVADLPGGKQRAVFLVHSVFLLIFSAYCRFLPCYYTGVLEKLQQRKRENCRFSGKNDKSTEKRRRALARLPRMLFPCAAYSASVSGAGCCAASYSASACASTFLSWRLCTCVRSNFSHRSGRRAMVRL